MSSIPNSDIEAIVRVRARETLAPPAPRHPISTAQNALRWIIVALCALAYWVCIDLGQLSGNGKPTNPLIAAVCGGANSGCASLLQSESAVAVLGTDETGAPAVRAPWSILGMGYFAAIGYWFALVGPVSRGRMLAAVPLLLMFAIGVWNSLTLLQAMAALGSICLGCLTVHSINLLVILLALAALPWRKPTAQSRPYPSIMHALTGMVAGGVIALLHLCFGVASIAVTEAATYRKLALDPEYTRWRYERAAHVDIPSLAASAADPAESPAAHTVVMFSDYRCPVCRRVHAALAAVSSGKPGLLRVEMRNYPMDTCNSNVRPERARHKFACDAAKAAEAVRRIGTPAAYVSYQAILFERQAAIDPAHLLQWAQDVGVDRAKFEAALEDPAIAERIRADVELAKSLNVPGPPTVYLDGKLVEDPTRARTWRVLLGLEPTSAPTQPASKLVETGSE